MDNVFFTPYIGPDYQQGYQGKKILALGESHYINDDEEGRDHFRNYPQLKDFTNDMIRSYFDYLRRKQQNPNEKQEQGWMRTYTKFARAFHNGDLSYAGIISLWEHIAFYNYIQEPAPNTRVSPAKELFVKYEAPFWEVVRACQPDLIIIWGLRLWDNLPFKKESHSEHLFRISATANDLSVLALPITHPSAPRFAYQTMYNKLTAALS